jgi:8-oxo-dGTP pyrophosphatase MutT (NUDIX family)
MRDIRQIFKLHFDDERILDGYEPFRHPIRKPGGLAHVVAVINGLLLAALFGAALYPIPGVSAGSAGTDQQLLRMSGVAAVVFVAGLFLQIVYIGRREEASKAGSPGKKPTHAGGIVFRVEDSGVRYLLVGPKKEVEDEWLFPKGHIDNHEGHLQAAVREVREETGVNARPICLVGTGKFKMPTGAGSEDVISKYYLMEILDETASDEPRRRGWFTYGQALRSLTHDQNRLLLHQAEGHRRRMTS